MTTAAAIGSSRAGTPLGTLFVRSLTDRIPSAMRVALAMGFYAFFGSWIYSGFADDIDDLLIDFPDELTALMGGSLVGATGGYVTSVMFNLLGPLVIGGLAVSWGAGAIAGEEAGQTARLLFAQPITRRQVLVSRAAAQALVVTAAVLVFGSLLGVAARLFADDPPTFTNVAAVGVHLMFFAVAMGTVALAAGSATGRKGVGVAAGGAVMAVSYLIDSFAPLTAAEGIERFTPWHLYNGHGPIDNGFHLGYLAILAAIAVAGLAIGVLTVDRRDLEPAVSPLLERVPGLGALVRPRVDSVVHQAASARLPAGVAVGTGLGFLALMMALMFGSVADSIGDLDLPEALEAAVGGASLATAEGWMNSQVLTIVGPLALVGLAIAVGSDATAGERDRHTLMLVLSAPITRTRFLAAKLVTMVVVVAVATGLLTVGLAAGSGMADLGLSAGGIVGAGLHLGALALMFGGVAAALGARLPKRTALGGTAGLAVASFLGHALLSSVEFFDGDEFLSPWELFIGNNPLENGPSVVRLAVLAALGLAAAVVSIRLFEEADAA